MRVKSLLLLFLLSALGSVSAEPIRISGDRILELHGVTSVSPELFGINTTGGWIQDPDRDDHYGSMARWLTEANLTAYRVIHSPMPKDAPRDPERPGYIDPAWSTAPERIRDYGLQHFFQLTEFGGVDQGIQHVYYMSPDSLHGLKTGLSLDAYAEWLADRAWMSNESPQAKEVGANIKFELGNEMEWNVPSMFSPAAIMDPTAPGPRQPGLIAVEEIITFYEVVADAIKRRSPATQIGGPATSHFLARNGWWGWSHYIQPWLLAVGDKIDFFTTHYYDFSPGNLHQIELEGSLLYAYTQAELEQPLPIYITEYNTTQSQRVGTQADDWKRIGQNAALLQLLLKDPDKWAGASFHVAFAWPGFSFNMLEREKDENEYRAWPIYYLFRVLRDLRGERLFIPKTDENIKLFGTRDTKTMTVVAFNNSDTAVTTPVQIAPPSGQRFVQGSLASLSYDEASDKVVFSESALRHDAIGWDGELALPPHGILALTWTLEGEAVSSSIVEQPEVVSSQTMVEAGTPVLIDLPESVLDKPGAKLRIGLRKDLGMWEDTYVRVNGHLLRLPTGGNIRGATFVEQEFDPTWLQTETVIETIPHCQGDYMITSAAIELLPEPMHGTATVELLSVEGGREVAPGDRVALLVTGCGGSRPLSWSLPDDWQVAPQVDSGGNNAFTLSVPIGVEPGWYHLGVACGDSAFNWSLRVIDPIICPMLTVPLSIDGDLAEWSGVPSISISGNAGEADALMFAWRPKIWRRTNQPGEIGMFYLAARLWPDSDLFVNERGEPVAIGEARREERRKFELLFDFGKDRIFQAHDLNDYQFTITLRESGEVAIAQTFWSGAVIKSTVTPVPGANGKWRKDADGVVTVEVAIPESAFQYFPYAPGMEIGFDVRQDDSLRWYSRAYDSCIFQHVEWGAEMVYQNPASWGLLRFTGALEE